MRRTRRVSIAQALGGEPDGGGIARLPRGARSGGGLDVVVSAEPWIAALPRHALLGGRPVTDRACALEGTRRAQTRSAFLDLPAGEPVGLPGQCADGPLPAESVRRARSIEQVAVHEVFTVAPAQAFANTPVRGEPHPCLVGQPACRHQLRPGEVHTPRLRRPWVGGVGGAFVDLVAQGGPRGCPHPGVEMTRVLLPPKFVAELRHILVRTSGHVIPDLAQGQQSMSDVGRQSGGSASLGWPDVVAFSRVAAHVVGLQRGVGRALSAPGVRLPSRRRRCHQITEVAHHPGLDVGVIRRRRIQAAGGSRRCAAHPGLRLSRR